MPTFVPSSYGDPYGTSSEVVVSDGSGNFAVRSDGEIEVLSGYPNVGQIFKPGNPVYDQVVKNLSAIRGNAAKIQAAIGITQYDISISAPPVQSTSGGTATMEDVATKQVVVPFYKQPWFLPATLGVVTLGAVAFILTYEKTPTLKTARANRR